MKIKVNDREIEYGDARATYAAIAAIAGLRTPSITFHHRPTGLSGQLLPAQKVPPMPGMEFTVISGGT